MADQKVSDLPSLNGADVDAADLLYIIDSSAGSAGSKKITVGQYQLAPVSGGTANGVLYLNASKVATAGSDLVFDGTNLGLGVTPSAWGAGFKALQVDSQSAVVGSGANIYLGANWLFTTGDRYIANGFATLYRQNAGQHIFYTAPSGTAGTAISFTQAMTLDADGELGIGTTSPGCGLDVRKQETSTYNTARFSNGTDVQFLDVVCGRALTNGTVGGVASSLVMTLRSSGSSSGHLAFATGNDERARVTQGGDLLVGTTTVSGAGGLTYLNQGSTGFASINNNNAGATGYVFSSYRRSSVEIGSVTQNGTTAVLFNTTSDRRLKENIVPAPSASAAIDAIQIVSHDWKAAPDEHVTYGVIAQDLALVAPQAVLQGDDGDEIEKTWGVDYSKLVPMLIKEIQTLRARVAALESA